MEKKGEPQRIIGMTGGQATNSYVAGQIEGGMGNTYHAPQQHAEKTFHNNVSGSSGVTTVNEVTGDTVNIGSGSNPTQQPASQAASTKLSDVTEEDIVGLLREKNLAKHTPLFQEHRIDGDLLSQLTDGELIDFGIGESFERKKILNLKKCLPK
ncbi:ankyrin repeat and SAM domain-containing protein 6-like isoform X2 [Haliotis rubra]|uniref:ankyrin repeat and SAM domain-containing protein 6-like isoform X2 n=1 Tax=Haliotis rubra TaxID=36100 RepID=UPI001EE50885|nr:ankyrin repeat and SAM domain-containing protein 6-like isoform X2 [Haliotis rubra]